VKPPVSPWRWARAWVLGGSAVALSAGGHMLGGGHLEPVLLVLLVALASLAAYGWLRSERGLLAIIAAVTVVQAVTHVILGAGHTHSSSSAMLAGHLLAGLLLAVLLRSGESRIFAAARRRYLQWQIAVRCALAGLVAPRGARPQLVADSAATLTSRFHTPVQGRGPPAAAFC
jgi:hypothetical protein